MASTTASTSANESGNVGIPDAALAFQEVLTPGFRGDKPARRQDTDGSTGAQQGKKPTGKRAAARQDDDEDDQSVTVDLDEGEEGEEGSDTGNEGDENAEGEGDDGQEGDEGDQGDESEESEGEESEGESDEGDGTEEADLDATYTVTHADGTEEDIPVAELVKGYYRQKDYTKKTQALAEERKVLRTQHQEVSSMRDQYAQGLEQLSEAIKATMPQEPDWAALKAQDPIEYGVQWADWQRSKALQADIDAERQEVARQQEHAYEMQRREAVRDGHKWLLEQVPEWKDPAKQKADRAAMRAFAEKVGFSAEELKAVDDPRAVLMIRQAMLYAKLQEKKPLLIKKTAKKPQTPGTKTATLKPQGRQHAVSQKSQRLGDARKRHAKEQSVESAAAVFQTLL